MHIFQRRKSKTDCQNNRLKQYLDADIDLLLRGKELDMKGCDVPVFNSESILHRIISRITPHRRYFLRLLFKWGVAAVVVIGLSVWTYKSMFPHPITYREVYAKKGERLVVVLADGTQVYLNADSRLTYPVTFSAKERCVKLQGEAYFTVEKDTDKPFIVESYDMMIKVTGTQFNVMAYPESSIITTTLDEGKILVGHKTKHPQLTELYPGQEALYKKGENTCTVQSAHTGKEASCWKENRLVFHNAGLQYILKTLERRYNIAFEIKNTRMLAYTYTFSCPDTDMGEVLGIMQTITPIRFRKIKEHLYTVN